MTGYTKNETVILINAIAERALVAELVEISKDELVKVITASNDVHDIDLLGVMALTDPHFEEVIGEIQEEFGEK